MGHKESVVVLVIAQFFLFLIASFFRVRNAFAISLVLPLVIRVDFVVDEFLVNDHRVLVIIL